MLKITQEDVDSLHTYIFGRGLGGGSVRCAQCSGWGRYSYPDTATWTDACIAGQAFTMDTCDVCWGSGYSDRPGMNLLEATKKIRTQLTIDEVMEAYTMAKNDTIQKYDDELENQKAFETQLRFRLEFVLKNRWKKK